MECVIHYEGQQKYSDLIKLTEKTVKRLILAKQRHETVNDEHQPQCLTIPLDGDLTKYHCHKEPCYKKFVRITIKYEGLKKTLPLSDDNPKCTRSKRTSNFHELSTPKKKRSDSQQLSPPSYSLRSPPSTGRHVDEAISNLPSTSSARNRYVFGKECVLCGELELRYKNKGENIREYPFQLTLDAAAKNIKDSASQKEEYSDLYCKIVDLDLIAAEFKYHPKCGKILTRPVKEYETSRGDPAGDFTNVTRYIDRHVLDMNQPIGMTAALNLYFGPSDEEISSATMRQRKLRLKMKLEKYYGQKLLILQTRKDSADIIINAKNLDSEVTVNVDRESVILTAAKYLRHDIEDYCAKLSPLNWPPTIEELLSEERLPPASVTLFLTNLLKSSRHSVTENIQKLVDSHASDFIHSVSGGSTLTPKHYLLGLGLHNMTGQKKVVQLTNRLGHCITYDTVLDIEIAQAQKALEFMNSSESSILPLRPATPENSVPTIFWVDNFDKNVDKEKGGGAINMTTMMAFQELEDGVLTVEKKTSVEKTKSRMLTLESTHHNISLNPKQEPPVLPVRSLEINNASAVNAFKLQFFTWLYLRLSNHCDQMYPTFPGFLLKLRNKRMAKQKSSIRKTVETYLPPFTTKVTDPQTIYSYMLYLQQLAIEMNMMYVNITLDVGAAINAYKILWKYSQQFANVVIHLGDFHIMKENFKVLGLLVGSSGFEEVVFQTCLCTSGSLAGVLSGSHYNRAWRIHEVLSEALERILYKEFLKDVKPKLSKHLADITRKDSEEISYETINITASLSTQFEDFKKKVREGHLGITAQFWLIYIEMMGTQQQCRVSVQENNYDLRLSALISFLPLYFYYNMHNYARYMCYYVHVLDVVDTLYPELKEMLSSTGLSIQAQDRYSHRTAVDMRGEQTINRDAKTSGGITHFASSTSSVSKWCLNRSDSAKNMKYLKDMTGLKETGGTYKSLRPTQILNSEKMISKVIDVIENEYINPFGSNIEKAKLTNISSGTSLEESIANDIVTQMKKGEKLAKTFNQERLKDKTTLFHQSIAKNNYKNFRNSSKTFKVKNKDGTYTIAEVNRNILGALASYSLKTGTAVDFEKALQYPLSPVPLSISHADGTQRGNVKSKLKDIIFDDVKELSCDETKNIKRDVVVVDMMGLMNTVTKIPSTYFELARLFLNMLPKWYCRVDVVADSYKTVTLHKKGDRSDESERIYIPSLQSRVVRDFNQRILRNRENKARLIELIFEYIKSQGRECLTILNSSEMVLSSEDECTMIKSTETGVDTFPFAQFQSTQDEADTKVILHAHKILEATDATVTIRSPSGDTDIIVLIVALLQSYKQRVVIDDFHGDGRKSYQLSDIEHLEPEIIDSLIGLHAFTGNDFVSSFFLKGKPTCFKVLKSSSKFTAAFARLGVTWDVSNDLFLTLQEFVAKLYGMKRQQVNEARYSLFSRKYRNENKTVDMSTIPPCESVLKLHSLRANFIAAIWKRSTLNNPEPPDITHHGWDQNKCIVWVTDVFPSDIHDILMDDRFNPDAVNDGQGESDDEESII